MSNAPKVRAITEMDNETFLKHINARHKGILPGIEIVGRSSVEDDATENLLRAYHEYRHEHDEAPTHTHREVPQ